MSFMLSADGRNELAYTFSEELRKYQNRKIERAIKQNGLDLRWLHTSLFLLFSF